MISMDPGVWCAVFLILATFSFIIKDTLIFRFAEATLVGTTAGVLAAQGLENVKRLAWNPIVTEAAYINIIPILLGIFMFTRISRRYAYLSRLPIALLLGTGLGIAIPTSMAAEIMTPINSLFKPMPTNALDIVNTIILMICVVSVFLLFTYTQPHTGALGIIARVGRYSLMFGLGATFAGHIYARAAWMLPNIQTIIWDWLGITI